MEYLIGDFSKISRLGIKTLRYYHEIGLLEPGRVDAFSGYRYYDEECLSRVRAISRLKDLNFSLGEIRDILAGKQKDVSVLQLLRKKLAEVEGQLAIMEKSRDQLAAFVNSESLPLLRPCPVAEKFVPDQTIASIRFSGRYAEVGGALSRLLNACGALMAGPPFSLYHDDQPMEEGADIEVCLPLSVSLADSGGSGGEGPRIPSDGVPSRMPPEGVKDRLLRGGRVVSIIHPGIYDQLWVSYQALVDYMNRRGLEQAGPAREIYLETGGLGGAGGGVVGGGFEDAAASASAAGHSAASSRFVTEIQFPVR
ncbi:MAG TPA: MerR family transcriptional regulator [Rectinemataceae bacterium]|nr:MerR family transcriptional regulator [Rectinemataceae bacterium]